MTLPALPYNFNHASIEGVVVGPRREVTLMVSPLVWKGQQGFHIPAVPVRFGGIVNFEQVSAFFAISSHNHTDLAWIRYDRSQHSKPESLFIELVYERLDAQVVIHCRSVSVTTAEPPAV